MARRTFSSTPTSKAIKHVGVVGAGQMGTGIAIVASQKANVNVTLVDPIPENISKSNNFVEKWCQKAIAKGRMTEKDVADFLHRIDYHGDVCHLRDVDFVIEAATEDQVIKTKIFKNLAGVVPDHAVLATNTSSLSVTRLAGTLPDADIASRVVGMHFFNPVPVMSLVEIVMALQTSDETLEATLDLAERMGKVCTRARDTPGFISNRILMPYINEAVFALYEGVGSVEDIDKTLKLGTNVPMGPLALADFIGLDTCLAIMRTLNEGFSDSKYRPCPLLVQYVEAGRLGKKTGRGFYKY